MLSSISSNFQIKPANLSRVNPSLGSKLQQSFMDGESQVRIAPELLKTYFMGRKIEQKSYEAKISIPETLYSNLRECIQEELSKSRSLPRAAEFEINEKAISGAVYKFDDNDSIKIKLKSDDKKLNIEANIDSNGDVTVKSPLEINEDVAASMLTAVIEEISDINSSKVSLRAKYEMIDKTELNEALKKMGPGYLKKPYSEWWSEDNPALGYCYNISEVIYHKFAPEGSKPVRIRFDDGSTHWWIKTPDDCILDQTGDQFDGKTLEHKGEKYNRIPYEMGTPGGFLTKLPSKRTVVIMNNLGIK